MSKSYQNSLKSLKNTKKPQKQYVQSQRENDLRPKLVPTTLAVMGILSSCPRVMTMQCWKSQIPPPLSTRLQAVIGFLVLCWPKRKEIRLSKIHQKNKTQRQEKNEHCTFIPNPQNSKNIKITTQNYQITAKSMKIYEKHKKHKKCQKTYKVKGETT